MEWLFALPAVLVLAYLTLSAVYTHGHDAGTQEGWQEATEFYVPKLDDLEDELEELEEKEATCIEFCNFYLNANEEESHDG